MKFNSTTLLAALALILTMTGCGGKGSSASGTSPGATATAQAPAATQLPPKPGEPPPIIIGVAGPMTGDLAQIGKMFERGVQLRIDQVNGGGVQGRRVQMELGDDAGNPKEASNVAQRFASNDQVLAVIGHYNSSCSLAGKEIYKEAGLVQFSPASTNPAVCVGSPWTFRNIYRDDYQGQMLARYCRNLLSVNRVAVFFDNDDYGIGLKDAFSAEARKIGLQVVAEQSYERDTADFRPQLSTFMPKRPEIIFVSGLFAQASKIASQARESGITIPMLGGDGVFSEEFIRNGGAATEDTYVVTPFLFELGGDRARDWGDAFRKKFKAEPDAWAVLAYDAVSMVLKAIEEKGAGRTTIRDYLAAINTPSNAFDGLGGRTYFDAEGDCLKPIHMALVKNGKFIPAPKQLN